MRDPEIFKYDVRVRERMLKAGRLAPEDLANLLAALPDVEANGAPIELDQPALAPRPAVDAAAASPAREVAAVAAVPAVASVPTPLDREPPQGNAP